jgi:hypothetical protein
VGRRVGMHGDGGEERSGDGDESETLEVNPTVQREPMG